MIDISKKSWRKYFLFSSLYFSEGIELAVITVLIPIYFAELGISLPITTFIIAIAALPWVLKFIWGGIVDHFIGFGRKRFIIVGGILGAFGLLLLAFVDPTIALLPFAFLMFISHIGIAFLDVSSDAWAIEISQEKERGKINGAMFAGQFTGLAVGSTLLAILANIFGYNVAFIIAGLIIILIIIYPLCVKYKIISKKQQKVGSLLVREFKKITTQLIALFAPIADINIGLLIIVPLYLDISLNLDIAQIGLITGIYTVMMAVGALIGGAIADKFSRKTALYVFIGASIFFIALLIFGISWQIFTFLYAIVGFLYGGFNAAGCTMCMDITNPKIGATQFSLLTSLFNLGDIVGTMVAGSLVVMLGFGRVFLYTALSLGPALLILYFIRIEKKDITP